MIFSVVMVLLSDHQINFMRNKVFCLFVIHHVALMCVLLATSGRYHAKRRLIVDVNEIQSTLVISNSKGLSETLRDIRTSTYQNCASEENNKSNNHN